MNVIRLELKQISRVKDDQQLVELRYWLPGENQTQYKSRKLALAEIAELYDFIDRDFTTRSLNLLQLGRRLFDWLDGNDRWLAQAIEQQGQNLVLAIDAQGQLGGLPWEILSDKQGFLVGRSIVPVRVIGSGQTWPAPAPNELRALFMVTDPDEASGLSYEQEEAYILEATEELAMELRVEESGCLEELEDLWRRFENRFQVFHLSGHANIKDDVPYFVTESLEGDRVPAEAADLAAVFSFRYPPLIFLSGCRTGESGKGVTSSLAASLVAAGAPAVLGWGRSVSDAGATAAAMVLYKSLSQGFSVVQALALTYQELLKAEVPDWCLLRLYAQLDCWGKLVLPPGDAVRQRPPEASKDEEFLDDQGLVRVAGKDAFVGQRRYLQRGLKALKSRQYLGIWLHGLGGAGKSSIACRLLDRLAPSYQKLVFTGVFDESLLVKKLVNEFAEQQAALTMAGSLVQRLTTVLKDVGRRQPIVFLLDNFEDNLEMLTDGRWVLKAAMVEPLEALLNGIIKSQVPHRVIVTSRYDVVLPGGLERQVKRLAVGGMGGDRQKLYRRLAAFSPSSLVDAGLQAKAQSIADGYPRLIGWLNDVLLDERTDSELILLAMEGKQQDFLENILAEKLLAQQEPGLVEMLERGMLFELPVPLAVLQSICANLVGFDGFVERARALGLLEAGLTDGLVRVPRVLGLVVSNNQQELAAISVKTLSEFYTGKPVEQMMCLEIYRLATLGKDDEIAIYVAKSLSNSLISRGLYLDALYLCERALKIENDSVIIYNLCMIYNFLGDMPKALNYLHQSVNLSIEIGDRHGEACSLKHGSIIYQELGNYELATSLLHKSNKIFEEIGSGEEKKLSLHQSSILHQAKGDYKKALFCADEALRLSRLDNDQKAEAACLRELSGIHENLGDYQQAKVRAQESMNISREINDDNGIASSLEKLSSIAESTGNLQEAFVFSEESINIFKQTGDRKSEASSLHQLSIIYCKLGEFNKSLISSEQSMKISVDTGFRQMEAASLHQQSVVYFSQGKIDHSLSLSERSIPHSAPFCGH